MASGKKRVCFVSTKNEYTDVFLQILKVAKDRRDPSILNEVLELPSISKTEEASTSTSSLTADFDETKVPLKKRRYCKSSSPEKSESEKFWAWEYEDESDFGDYEIQCICHIPENDEFMVQCDICLVWQHCECVGIMSKSEVPDRFECETCDPSKKKQLRHSTAYRRQVQKRQCHPP